VRNNYGMGFGNMNRFEKIALYTALFTLPFTHAPTVDLPFRWRIAELIAWLVGIPLILKPVRVWSKLAKVFLVALGSYMLWCASVGVVNAFFITVKVPAALEGTYHPLFRTVLESFRFAASWVLVAWLFRYVTTQDKLRTTLTLIVLGGNATSVYAIYETMVLFWGFPGPLLPGSRSIPGFPVASTMYEPSSVGSYAAIAMLLALGLFLEKKSFTAGLSVLLNAIGILVATSRTGVAASAVGLLVFLLILLQQGQIRSSVKIGTSLGLIGLLAAYLSSRLLGQKFYERFSSYYVEYSLSLRYQETYQYVVPDLLQYTLGLGQGLWLYSVGGGAGLARLVVEGGIPGLIFLGNGFAVLWITLIRLVKTCRRALEGSLVAAVIATLVSLYNYVNITDLWIWVVLSLPFVALNTRNQETVQFQNLRDPNAL
jgi:hypothetical protein